MRKLYYILVVMIVMHLVLQYGFYLDIDFRSQEGWKTFLQDLFGNIVIFLIAGGIPAVVFALIPFRKKKYIEKFKTIFSAAVIVFLFIYIFSYSYFIFALQQKSYKNRFDVLYSQIKTTDCTDCSSLKTGKFETGPSVIERSSTMQVEIEKKTGKKYYFHIKWLNNCEYQLIPEADPDNKIYCKITQVKNDFYDCFVTTDQTMEKHAMFVRVNITKL